MWARTHILFYNRCSTIDTVRDDIASLIERHGAHLVGFKVSGGNRSKVIEVLADTESGIDADLLADISRSLSQWLDASEAVTGDYRLIVSSPGLDNPLLYGWQYNRHKGKQVHIITGEGDDVRHIDGTIQLCENNIVTIAASKSEIVLPLDEIISAKIIPSLK